METKYIEVTTTVSSERDAEQIGQIVVSRRLASCVQIVGPIESTYWWGGVLETAREWKCVFKTTKKLYPRIEKSIRELHNYEVPEIIAVPIVFGIDDYLSWIDEQTLQEEDF